MSGSSRKRKSKWDLKEETQLPGEISENNAWPGKAGNSNVDGSHGPNRFDLEFEANDALKTNGSFEWSSWEPLHGNIGKQKDESINRDFSEIPDTTRAWDGHNSCSMSMSPVFDGWGRQNHSRSPENSWSRSHRGSSKSRGRSRSRSWSRSRSRSHSRSPFRDLKPESYGWRDRSRSGSGISRPCRDFAAGKCRRGSQCRFLHQDKLNYRDGGRSEIDPAESWGSRQEHGGASRYANTGRSRNYPLDKVSDGYRNHCDGEKDEPLRNSSRFTNRCNDFLKGRCHRGSSCRYAHHGASADGYESYDRSNRNASLDHDHKREPHRSGDTPCKYFAMGRCRNGNHCRFSHDGPAHGNLKERSPDDRWDHNLDDKNKPWGGPKWSDTTAVSEIAKSTGWGNNNVENVNFTDPTAVEKSTDERCPSLDNENTRWGSPVWEDKAAEGDEGRSFHWGSRSANMGIPESTVAEKLFDKEELPLIPQGSQPQTLNGISIPVREQNIRQKASGLQLGARVVHPAVSENSYIQQQVSKRGDNNAIIGGSNSPNEGQIFNGDSLVSQPPSSFSEASQSQQLLSQNPSNGHTFDLNGPVQQITSPLNLQYHTQFHQEESVKTPEMVEFEVPQVTSGTPQNVVTSEQVALTNLSASLAQIFGNGPQLPQLYAALNPPNSTGLVPSLPDSASLVPSIASMVVQPNPATWSQEHYDPIGDSIESSKPGNSNQPHGILSNPIEQKNQMPSKCLSPSSATGGPNSGEPHKSGSSEEEHHEIPKLKLQEPIANSEVKETNEIVAEECKQQQENDHSENVDADGRVEEGNGSKDEKGMRTFKFALVEFVKEILKPTWKEGQMSKEVHKTIVKKVVDKVVGTIQGVHIPNTEDKIDQYLSSSKPKLTKLVQAYVERYLNLKS